MCGIAGGWSVRRFDALRDSLPSMTRAIAHRGPDDSGHWTDEACGVALGHRRLAIVDVSPLGHQPMASAAGRYVIVYNGEIYNHRDLRQQIDNEALVHWRGHSDTETLLAAIETWGLDTTLDRCAGMFALALWDRESRTLSLARDRLGEKPLYYGWQGDSFVFASELSALAAAPGFAADIDRDALALYMRYANVPSPWSIYQGIRKLPPGSTLSLAESDMAARNLPAPETYWSVVSSYAVAQARPFQGTDAEAVTQLEALLGRAVTEMSLADVPLGAFLSGGIDSSTIVALMQERSSRPVKTFTIGFEDARYNEAAYAARVAQHLGTEHTQLYLSDKDVLEAVPDLATVFSEPFADSSQLPTYLVSRLARRHVTVSLSGDAGDELFHGYDRYQLAGRVAPRLEKIPHVARRVAAAGIKAVPMGAWDALASIRRNETSRKDVTGDRVHKFAEMITYSGDDGFYRAQMTHWSHAESIVHGSRRLPDVYSESASPLLSNRAERYMCKDLRGYLPDDILTKVDRAAMAVSLETRVPLLDHRVVEFALSLPMHLKQRGGTSKWLLRQLLHKRVPPALFERPKMGFAIPLGGWLRGPLREWAEALLNESRLRQEGFFDTAIVRRRWQEHLDGKRDWQRHLWDVLMFQAWLDRSSKRQGS